MKRVAAMLLMAGGIGYADTSLIVTADTFTGSGTAQGKAQLLQAAQDRQTLLLFRTSGILPPGFLAAAVQRAVLKIYVNKLVAAGEIQVSQATSAWDENTTTAPAAGAALATAAVSKAQTYVLMDVTSAVRHWLTFPALNFGLIVAAAPGSLANLFLDSMESTGTSHAAELEITNVKDSGPIGPRGPTSTLQGPPGAPGDRGPRGLVLLDPVSNSDRVCLGRGCIVEARCDSTATMVVSGSCGSGNVNATYYVVGSGPSADNKGWRCAIQYFDLLPPEVTVAAVCMK